MQHGTTIEAAIHGQELRGPAFCDRGFE